MQSCDHPCVRSHKKVNLSTVPSKRQQAWLRKFVSSWFGTLFYCTNRGKKRQEKRKEVLNTRAESSSLQEILYAVEKRERGDGTFFAVSDQVTEEKKKRLG